MVKEINIIKVKNLLSEAVRIPLRCMWLSAHIFKKNMVWSRFKTIYYFGTYQTKL